MESPSGLARVYLHAAERPRAGLVLGHGAGGGVEAPDLVAVREVALAEGVSVGLVEQPYRVAGRRSPASAGQLDAAWLAVVSRLRERELGGLPLLVGGRSLGARVACRTAGLTDAVAVVCLAFPLQPPQPFGIGSAPEPSCGTGRGRGSDPGRARNARPVRDSAREPTAHGGRGTRRPQPQARSAGSGCRCAVVACRSPRPTRIKADGAPTGPNGA